uniref:Evasin n=1 Tax=Amblyomma parvum TaxID=251391 RepID=A0A023G057_AMBPA
MLKLWIVALAFGALAAGEKEPPGAVPGCGGPAEKPKEKNYGTVTDTNSCEKRYLEVKGKPVLASCMRHCPRKNASYPLRNGERCLQFMKKGFLLERADESKNTCRLGLCLFGKCRRLRNLYPVMCTVPQDKEDLRE